MPEPKLLLSGLCFPEGPRWHEGRLYFSDMHAKEVVAVTLDGQRETIAQVPNQPSGIGFLADGRMLVVSMRDQQLLRGHGPSLEPYADLSRHTAYHCNDMVVDSRGRAYVGHFGFDHDNDGKPRYGSVIFVDENAQVRTVASDMAFPNGSVITPDGRTLIVAETYLGKLTAFDIADDGSLSGRRLWAQLTGAADGICLDAEGCIWVGYAADAGGFVRVAEGGEIKARIETPGHLGIACMLGGPQRRTLFLLEAVSSRPQLSTPGNGRIRCLEVDVPGAGLPSAS